MENVLKAILIYNSDSLFYFQLSVIVISASYSSLFKSPYLDKLGGHTLPI